MTSKRRKYQRVLIDTDIAIGIPERDVDDGLAIVMARNSESVELAAISLTYGNDSLANVSSAIEALAAKDGLGAIRIAPGAAGPDERGKPTEAIDLLAGALEQGPATILCIGPVTNVASLIELRPDLVSRIEQVVAVAGRRKGQRFLTGDFPKSHPDLNFEKDPDSFAVLLESGIPLVLTPFEVSSKVWVTEAVLAAVASNNSAVADFLVLHCRRWLSFWQETFSTESHTVTGFNPFDCLAVAWLTDRDLLTWSEVELAIEEGAYDTTEEQVQGSGTASKPYLHAFFERGAGRVKYIHDVRSEEFLTRLIGRLR